jgi:hypothetical protein
MVLQQILLVLEEKVAAGREPVHIEKNVSFDDIGLKRANEIRQAARPPRHTTCLILLVFTYRH